MAAAIRGFTRLLYLLLLINNLLLKVALGQVKLVLDTAARHSHLVLKCGNLCLERLQLLIHLGVACTQF